MLKNTIIIALPALMLPSLSFAWALSVLTGPHLPPAETSLVHQRHSLSGFLFVSFLLSFPSAHKGESYFLFTSIPLSSFPLHIHVNPIRVILLQQKLHRQMESFLSSVFKWSHLSLSSVYTAIFFPPCLGQTDETATDTNICSSACTHSKAFWKCQDGTGNVSVH